jgi:hypothetical protein
VAQQEADVARGRRGEREADAEDQDGVTCSPWLIYVRYPGPTSGNPACGETPGIESTTEHRYEPHRDQVAELTLLAERDAPWWRGLPLDAVAA